MIKPKGDSAAEVRTARSVEYLRLYGACDLTNDGVTDQFDSFATSCQQGSKGTGSCFTGGSCFSAGPQQDVVSYLLSMATQNAGLIAELEERIDGMEGDVDGATQGEWASSYAPPYRLHGVF
jgi:hypothetical protein